MQIDLVGRVKSTRLPARHGLMPLFEAVVNSIHAIQDTGRSADREIRIEIERDPFLFPDDAGASMMAPIGGFLVQDNGVGFTPKNYESFDTVNSRAKALRGGKGVGRLLWLKAFERVEIQSIFQDGGRWYRRRFTFRLSHSGIENPQLAELEGHTGDTWTEVRLVGFFEMYRKESRKTAEAIGRRIVEHCLEYYLLRTMPRVTLHDPAYQVEIDLHDLYQQDFRPESQSRTFSLKGYEFTLQDVLIRSTSDIQHSIKYCAHDRVVQSVPLASEFPHLHSPLRNAAGELSMYYAYVSSTLLDERVDEERTGFNIERLGELGEGGDEVGWEDVHAATVGAIKDFVGPRTAELRREALNRIERYVVEEAPRYRPLLGHKKEELAEIPGNLPEEKLDLALHLILAEWQRDVRSAANRLQGLSAEEVSFEEHRREFVRLLGELQEVAKSDLAAYVVHRATVLSFFEKLQAPEPSGKFPKEDALHRVFFPPRKTSNDVAFEDHNLWMLDERLAYHRYLASDIKFSKQLGAPIEVNSDSRPDILIYNTPMAFVTGDSPFGSVVIVEFKRPERDDLRGEQSPIQQVLDYVRLIRDGKARHPDGSVIEPMPNVPIYCFIVATITDSLRREAENGSFTPTPDGRGYFHFNPNLRAYLEISSFRKVLDDAKRRNKAFFDKLQLRLP